MNTYKIIFTRENGTQGTDHFTAANEHQARAEDQRHPDQLLPLRQQPLLRAPGVYQLQR